MADARVSPDVGTHHGSPLLKFARQPKLDDPFLKHLEKVIQRWTYVLMCTCARTVRARSQLVPPVMRVLRQKNGPWKPMTICCRQRVVFYSTDVPLIPALT